MANGTGGFDFTAVSPLAIPELAALFQRIQSGMPNVPSFEPMFNRVAGMIPEQTQSFESILSQGTGSPLIQQVMQMLLPSLATGEEQAREALTDRFRAAGGLRSGAYGVAAPRLEGELAAKRGGVMSQLISSLLGPLISGSLQAQEQSFLPARTLMQLLPSLMQSQENQFLPTRSLIDLLQASRPQVQFGRSIEERQLAQREAARQEQLAADRRSEENLARFNEFMSPQESPFPTSMSAPRQISSGPSVGLPGLTPSFGGGGGFGSLNDFIYDPFAGGVSTGSLNDIFYDPNRGYSNFTPDIENLPFFDSGAFEY